MYRKDNRTLSQFKKDIKESSLTERKLMNLYLDFLNSKVTDNNYYYYLDNGIDNSGEFISNDKKVTSDPDFLLCRQGNPNHKIEIKFCKPDTDRFHLKLGHIKRCIKEDVCIINWMGIETENRRFCILTPKELKYWLKNGYHTSMWSKPCIRIMNSKVTWYKQ